MQLAPARCCADELQISSNARDLPLRNGSVHAGGPFWAAALMAHRQRVHATETPAGNTRASAIPPPSHSPLIHLLQLQNIASIRRCLPIIQVRRRRRSRASGTPSRRSEASRKAGGSPAILTCAQTFKRALACAAAQRPTGGRDPGARSSAPRRQRAAPPSRARCTLAGQPARRHDDQALLLRPAW